MPADIITSTVAVRASDKRIACDEDLSDSEDEGDGRKDEQNFKAKRAKTTTTSNGDSKPIKEAVVTATTTEEPGKPAADAEKPMETAYVSLCSIGFTLYSVKCCVAVGPARYINSSVVEFF